MPIRVADSTTVEVTTPKLSAVFSGPKLISLRSAAGQVLLERDAQAGPAGVELLFADEDAVPLGRPGFSKIRAVQVSQNVAHVHVEDDDGDAFLRLAVGSAGELLVEPSAQTIRRGLGGVRLNLAGVAPACKLVAPFFEGCRQELDCPLVVGQWAWPQSWEAALAVCQGDGGGWSVCTHDARALPKTLCVGHEDDAHTLGFDSEAIGPWDQNTAVGSLTWILDTHQGDWTVAADAYRRWLHEHVNAPALKAARPDWWGDIRLAVKSCPPDADFLDALARVIPPHKVLLHVKQWRTDAYDENYPEYIPSKAGKEFAAYATQRGFHVQPHFNHFAIDPNHTLFPRVRDFIMRDVRTKKILGWRWKESRRFAFPQSPSRLAALRHEKTMAYLHTGLSTWRRLLVERIAATVREMGVGGAHVDQTLATYNLDNGLVENLTSAEGVMALTRELTNMDARPAITGEGRDEMIMRYLSFGTTPLFKSWHRNVEHYEQLDPVPLCHRLYGDLCRAWGARSLADTPEGRWCVQTHLKLDTLPTIVAGRAEELTQPTANMRLVLDRAAAEK